MHHSSRRFLSLVLAIDMSLAFVGHAARAQDSDDIPSPTRFVSEETVDQMARAYKAIEEIRTKTNDELKGADDQNDARQIRHHAQDAMIRAIERTGLNLRDFNRLSQLAALDPTLAERIRTRMLEREPI